MARTLTVARARVPEGAVERYRALLPGRAAAARQRGARFWVFRSVNEEGVYLEFTEAPDGSAGARTSEEIGIEREMRELALYGPDAEVVWEEVHLEERQTHGTAHHRD